MVPRVWSFEPHHLEVVHLHPFKWMISNDYQVVHRWQGPGPQVYLDTPGATGLQRRWPRLPSVKSPLSWWKIWWTSHFCWFKTDLETPNFYEVICNYCSGYHILVDGIESIPKSVPRQGAFVAPLASSEPLNCAAKRHALSACRSRRRGGMVGMGWGWEDTWFVLKYLLVVSVKTLGFVWKAYFESIWYPLVN